MLGHLLFFWSTSSRIALAPSRTRALTSCFTASSNSFFWVECSPPHSTPTCQTKLSSTLSRFAKRRSRAFGLSLVTGCNETAVLSCVHPKLSKPEHSILVAIHKIHAPGFSGCLLITPHLLRSLILVRKNRAVSGFHSTRHAAPLEALLYQSFPLLAHLPCLFRAVK